MTQLIRKRLPKSVFKHFPLNAHAAIPVSVDDVPLRAELFSVEQLRVHAKTIAQSHKVAIYPGPDRLLSRLDENEKILLNAYHQVSHAVRQGHRISPASEWLIDNFYLIEEQIQIARRHLPKRYSRQLPQLANGPVAGYPRVYHIALELITHSDSGISLDNTTQFVQAYQASTRLCLGELWAVPIMLRLGLLESLRGVASRIASGRRDRDLAVEWTTRLISAAETAPASLIMIVADLARSNPPLSIPFVTEFFRQLQGKSPALVLALTWMEQRLSEQGRSVEACVQLATQNQTTDQVTLSNCIASLRLLGAIDWRDFVEGQSVVEAVLRTEPSTIYLHMDFATRDRYRHEVEDIAHWARRPEEEVAREAVHLCTQQGAVERKAHVGYYLIGKGVKQLETAMGARVPLSKQLGRIPRRFPLAFYLGSMGILTVALAAALSREVMAENLIGWGAGVIIAAGILCLWHLSIAVVNWEITLFIEPYELPRMDFSKGIPPESSTVVVVPTMLTSVDGVADQISAMEVRYLANRDANVRFAMLTDFRDASAAKEEDDDRLLAVAREGIESLNARYAAETRDRFYLFHRPRLWNQREKIWMGYERKRGKLADFNALILRGVTKPFSAIIGDTSALVGTRYVITLDTDTELPRDAARQLAATMAHPLNRPRLNPTGQCVDEGYSILQPRVAAGLPNSGYSRLVKIFGDEPGIDPYTRAVSDLYQDLFGEGSFIGKGIYDVAAFDKCLQGRFPENRILSHDLLEGAFARSGLISEVQLYEDQPWHFQTEVRRRHRWIRGDWQLLAWLMPWVPTEEGRRTSNTLTPLSLWKLFDNLHRSLVPAAFLVLFLTGWALLSSPGIWTCQVLGIIFTPMLLAAFFELLHKPTELPMGLHLRAVGASAARQLIRVVCTLAFLPDEALVSLDAIAHTLFRLFITRRRLLEWVTSSEAHRHTRSELGSFFLTLGESPILAAGTGVVLAIWKPTALPGACPILMLWFLSPVLAWWLSQPLVEQPVMLGVSYRNLLRKTARRTWHYFETYVGVEDHFLPPDNVQEQPIAVIAHRTSPTNIGMALLSTLAAHDFGYIPVTSLLDRVSSTLNTLDSMQRHNGHFFNWYDTRTLQPLPPLYISTVDSGNLVGHLLTLRQGLLELPRSPILSSQVFAGFEDILLILQETIVEDPANSAGPTEPSSHQALVFKAKEMLALVRSRATSLRTAFAAIQRLTQEVEALSAGLALEVGADVRWAVAALENQCHDVLTSIRDMAAWLVLPAAPEEVVRENRVSWRGLRGALEMLDAVPSLEAVASLRDVLFPLIDEALKDPANAATESSENHWLISLRSAILSSSELATRYCANSSTLADRCQSFSQMDFQFLFDEASDEMVIGYNVTTHRQDPSYYDLLASEARLSSFIAIAQGQIPQEHWFRLGRQLTTTAGKPALLSWSGSMFEYLMPLLVMPTYQNTLLDRTYRAVVSRQISYGNERGVPWGISESGYNTTDAQLNYQYRAFGVPGLGFKPGLAEDLVIAPYATVMAVMVDPQNAVRNLERLAKDGVLGRFGYYEALDYTPSRVPRGQTRALVKSFMAHHQGMSLLSLLYFLLGRPMQRRFLADPLLRATELLLHERMPKAAPVYPHAANVEASHSREGESNAIRVYHTPNTPTPEIHFLSNGRYHVMISNAGSGYSRWGDMAVTRWREDPTRDCWGNYCYIRDAGSNSFWSAAYQPTQRMATRYYEASFQQARVEIRRSDRDIESMMEIGVSPEDDVEIRRVTLTNRSRFRRTIELTSYGEVVIAPPAADAAHPVFSNLFVNTRIVRDRCAILCTRRPRSASELPPWMLHLMAIEGTEAGTPSFECDRNRFIGRGRRLDDPAAMGSPRLSDSQGPVLDPIVSIRRTLVLEPHQSAKIIMVTGMADTEERATALIEKYFDPRLADRAFEMAHTHSQVILQQLNITEAEAQLFSRMAGAIIHPNKMWRADDAILFKNRRGQSGLWSYSISGDLPIVLLRIVDASKIEIVRQMVLAHAYWRRKGLAVDLVIWNEDNSGYRQALHDLIAGIISAGPEAHTLDRPAGIFIRRTEFMTDEDRTLIQSVARIIFTDGAGPLAEQINRPQKFLPQIGALVAVTPRFREAPVPRAPARELVFFNGYGGFTPDGKEYVVTLQPGVSTPAPWVNVIANPRFGTVISESGGIYTWAQNAHEFRLTPWSNDPVSDSPGEAFFIRDEESAEFWSPSPLPARGPTSYTARHGMGYSAFEHLEKGIHSELFIHVDLEAPVKFAVLKLTNRSGRPRRLSVTGYVEWVLGDLRGKSLMHAVTEVDSATGALLARNSYNAEFANQVCFFDVNVLSRSVTGDRSEFLGRNRSLAAPAAMSRLRLSNRTGAGFDSCGAIQVPCELADGQQREIVFILGAGDNLEEARALVQRFRSSQGARQSLETVWDYWSRTLGAVQVETPDPSVNILANGWLLYQTLACRMWARSGFYQSGGAYGFRDQLQDAMALVHSEPRLLREHLLRCAAHQFREGDVQHWWHPPIGRGVRTHFSDDYLWLPLAVARYVLATNDTGVLDESIHYLEGRPVNPDEEAYYDLPAHSNVTATLYDHCVKAIENGLKFGAHGLPLMGCGDWNDGMNLVGAHGKGESVWLAFFLFDVLGQFGLVARRRGDIAFADRCASLATELQSNIETNAWDGKWYRRAYFDDGEPLGSTSNPECQIDSIPQSWSVIAGAGEPARRIEAMSNVDARLVRRDSGIIQLFDPPFDKSSLNPGYIKGYLPGIRENGGQYTHAAVWTTMAFALLGDHARAWELFAMINPLHRGGTAEAIATYKVEPYVVAADVYAVPPHTGRGGWTWYTGSAGWMYRLLVEILLGISLEGDRLHIEPRLPKDWDGFKVHYRYRDTFYHITIKRSGTARILVDGVEQDNAYLLLADDRHDHCVTVELQTAVS